MSIVHSREIGKLKLIERMVQAPFHKLEIPSGTDVCRKQFFKFMDRIIDADISHGSYEAYVPMLEEKFANMTKEDVLKRVAALEFDRFLKYYENAEDLNVRDRVRQPWDKERTGEFRKRDSGDAKREYRSNGNSTKLFVNLGTKDGFYKASFLQFILDMSDLRKDVLGKIDMKEMNTWLEVEKDAAKKMIRAIDGKNYKGRRIRMNEANR
jgi:ATP-dependent RNA helicase DeaD